MAKLSEGWHIHLPVCVLFILTADLMKTFLWQWWGQKRDHRQGPSDGAEASSDAGSPMKSQKLSQCSGNLILLSHEDPGGLSSRRKYLSPSCCSALIQIAIVWSISIQWSRTFLSPQNRLRGRGGVKQAKKKGKSHLDQYLTGFLDDTSQRSPLRIPPQLLPQLHLYQKQYSLPLIKPSTFMAQCVGLERSFG